MANSLTESRRKIILNSPHIESVSGSIVSVNDAIKAKLKSCVVDINPVQSGSGNPSPDNIRPISGWTECNITNRNSVDIFPIQEGTGDPSPDNIRPIKPGLSLLRDDGTTLDVYGGTLDVTNGVLTVTYARFIPNFETIWKLSGTDNWFYGYLTNKASGANKAICSHFVASTPGKASWYSQVTLLNTGFTERQDLVDYQESFSSENKIKIIYVLGSSHYITYQLTHAELLRALKALGNDTTVSFPTEAGTVYKGKLDVINGVLTVTHIGFDMGNRSWSMDSNTSLFYTWVTSMKVPSHALSDISSMVCCSSYKPGFCHSLAQIRLNKVDWSIYIQTDNAKIYIYDTRFTTVEDFKAANVGQTLVVQLATPVIYQLTPTQIDAVMGTNTILADTGDTSVKYWAHS